MRYEEAVEALLDEVNGIDFRDYSKLVRDLIPLLRRRLMNPPFVIRPTQLEESVQKAEEYNKANPGLATLGVTANDLNILLKGALVTSCSAHFTEEFRKQLMEVRTRLNPLLLEIHK